MTSHPPPPELEYRNRLQDRRSRAGHQQRLDERIGAMRLAVFVSALGILGAAWQLAAVAAAWAAIPGALFVALVIFHIPVKRRRKAAEAAAEYYRHGLARIGEEEFAHGPQGRRYLASTHPYSADLDLFGPDSLFQRLCAARTQLGEDTLADWLSAPADIETVRSRQQAVDEIRPQVDLREQLALLDAEVHDDLDQNRLSHWSQQPARTVPFGLRLATSLAAAATVAGLLGWLLLGATLSWFVLALLAQGLLLFWQRGLIRETARDADEAGAGLAILIQVLSVLEDRRFESPLLQRIRRSLDVEGSPPSRRIARLQTLIGTLNNSLHNQFFMPIALVLGLPLHLVHAIGRWQARAGRRIPTWLRAVGEFEALVSFSRHAYENPADPFPELVAAGPRFEALALCHPLLPRARCIANDVALDPARPLLMVSGSNMSGKSTLLRSVGVNAVLALAGAPVRARSLTISPLIVGTSMRVNDSLASGESLFYAAVSRLKAVVELAQGPLPLLFLLDEILQGTNSHDRQVGAEGIIRGLIDAGAIGLVTTHDLALTDIVDALGPRARNVHFEDQLVDGRMTFDYKMRPGVVRRSNALELMRLVGLDV